jgi:hypothetical protein
MVGIYSKGKVTNGILRADLDNFVEFFQFSQWFHEGVGRYYFRGQSNSEWGLTTTLERFESGLYKHARGTGAFILQDFKRLLRGKGLLANMDRTSDEEILALGQHYGLPTPLLDWSESLYIALFFAFCEEIPKSVDRICVWAIQTSASEIMDHFNEKALAGNLSGGNDEDFLPMKFVDPHTDVNSRLVSQSGLFLQKPSGVSVEELVAEYCANNNNSPVLAKITVPVKERESVLNNLLAMNVSWATIYPGIEGAALHAKMKLQLLSQKADRMGVVGVGLHAAKNIKGATPGKD